MIQRRLEFTRRAERDAALVPRGDLDQLRWRFEQLAANAPPVDVRKLPGPEGRWLLRIGRWRAILSLDTHTGTIIVIRILPSSSE